MRLKFLKERGCRRLHGTNKQANSIKKKRLCNRDDSELLYFGLSCEGLPEKKIHGSKKLDT